MATTDQLPLHRQVFAVKVFVDDGNRGAWCIERVFRLIESARAYAKDVAGRKRLFPLVNPKVVRPSKFELEAFLLYNDIG
jgi:hypothetical protein